MQNFWFLLLEFLRKKNFFFNQDERVGGVNKQIRRSCWRSKAVHCKLSPSHLFLSFLRRPRWPQVTGPKTLYPLAGSRLYLLLGSGALVSGYNIVSRGVWLANPTKIKVENNGAVGYVGSSLTVHNPLFSVDKL